MDNVWEASIHTTLNTIQHFYNIKYATYQPLHFWHVVWPSPGFVFSCLKWNIYRSIHVAASYRYYFIHFNGWIIFHCTHVTHLNQFLCQWTFRLLPWLGYCKQCYNEHWSVYILLEHGFLQIYARNEIARSYGSPIFSCFFFFLKEPPHCPLGLP